MRALVLSFLLLASSCRALRGYAETRADGLALTGTEAEQGARLVVHGDFGTLTTDNLTLNAVPWKLFTVLPDVVPEAFYGQSRHAWASTPGEPLKRFGFVTPTELKGVLGVVPRPNEPIGYAHGTATRTWPDLTVELASTNCTLCHGGRGFDAQGRPSGEVVWGVPNHSIDFDGLIAAVMTAMKDPRATDDALLTAMERRYPQLSAAERETYRKYVLKGFRDGLKSREAQWGWLHPWRFGGPGFSNGAAILKEKLGATGNFAAAHVKIPNLYSVLQKKFLLIDGSYHPVHSATADQRMLDFLVGFLPVFGASFERSVAAIPDLERVREFLKAVTPPPFPGGPRASTGEPLFVKHCASCHGQVKGGAYLYPSVSVSLSAIGTDPTRARGLEQRYLDEFNDSVVGAHLKVVKTEAYVAPSLKGVWAQAPYFHNGSVPTLWHVLHPAERPAKFWVGGHSLDLVRGGILLGEPDASGCVDYPKEVLPWSEPTCFDTSKPGNSNRGHELQLAGLSEEDKDALLSYLLTL